MNGRGSLVESGEAWGEQYSLAKILGIWALAAAPMGILSWIVFPLLAPDFGQILSHSASRGWCCSRWVWCGCLSFP
jgi:hypothetical protein